MNFIRRKDIKFSIEQHLELQTNRLANSPYLEDKTKALEEIQKIADSNTFIVGINSLQAITDSIEKMEEIDLQIDILLKIFNSQYKHEFIDIFLKKDENIAILANKTKKTYKILAILSKNASEKVFKTLHLKGLLFQIISNCDLCVSFIKHLIKSEYKRFFVMEGIFEELLKIINRSNYRYCIDILCKLLKNNVSNQNYFMELRWKEKLIDLKPSALYCQILDKKNSNYKKWQMFFCQEKFVDLKNTEMITKLTYQNQENIEKLQKMNFDFNDHIIQCINSEYYNEEVIEHDDREPFSTYNNIDISSKDNIDNKNFEDNNSINTNNTIDQNISLKSINNEKGFQIDKFIDSNSECNLNNLDNSITSLVDQNLNISAKNDFVEHSNTLEKQLLTNNDTLNDIYTPKKDEKVSDIEFMKDIETHSKEKSLHVSPILFDVDSLKKNKMNSKSNNMKKNINVGFFTGNKEYLKHRNSEDNSNETEKKAFIKENTGNNGLNPKTNENQYLQPKEGRKVQKLSIIEENQNLENRKHILELIETIYQYINLDIDQINTNSEYYLYIICIVLLKKKKDANYFQFTEKDFFDDVMLNFVNIKSLSQKKFIGTIIYLVMIKINHQVDIISMQILKQHFKDNSSSKLEKSFYALLISQYMDHTLFEKMQRELISFYLIKLRKYLSIMDLGLTENLKEFLYSKITEFQLPKSIKKDICNIEKTFSSDENLKTDNIIIGENTKKTYSNFFCEDILKSDNNLVFENMEIKNETINIIEEKSPSNIGLLLNTNIGKIKNWKNMWNKTPKNKESENLENPKDHNIFDL